MGWLARNFARPCPPSKAITILKSHLSLHIPYDAKAFELAINNWPKSHEEHMKNEKDQRKIYKYAESVYKQILEEEE